MLSNKKFLTGSVMGAGLVMAVIRIFLILENIEKDTLDTSVYFLDDNGAVYSFASVTAVLCVLFVFSALFFGRRKKACFFDISPAYTVASVICGFSLLGEAVIAIASFMEPTSDAAALELLVLVFALAGAVYFFYVGFFGSNKKTRVMVSVLALLPVLLSVARILCDFVRQSAIPLASSGAYHILSLIALMLFFLCEGKARAGLGSAAVFAATGYCAVLLLMIYAVPNLFLHSYWLMDFDHITAFSVVDICIAIYVCVRIITCSFDPPKTEIPSAVEAASADREQTGE